MTPTIKDSTAPTVCLFGASLDVGNMGCRALAVSLVGLIARACPDAVIYLLYANRTGGVRRVRLGENEAISVEVVNYRMSPRARMREHLFCILLLSVLYRLVPIPSFRAWVTRSNRWIGCLVGADFVGEIFGGDSFSDIYGLRRLFWGAMPVLVASLLRKRVVLLPQTYGPYQTAPSRTIARFVLSCSRTILSRDSVGLETVRELLRKTRNSQRIGFCPDVAFGLSPLAPVSVDFRPGLEFPGHQPVVGLNVSGLLHMGGYTRANMFGLKSDYAVTVRMLIQGFLDMPDVRILLLPHTFGGSAQSDQAACEAVWTELQGFASDRLHILQGDYDQNEMKWIIGRCGFFLGSRMHACIAGLSQGVPSVGIAYSRKFSGVYESIGMGDLVIDARATDARQIVARSLDLYAARQEIRDRLEVVVPGIHSDLEHCFRELVSRG